MQAAIELLDEIIVAARDNGASADNLIKKYFQTRRYAGSKDRRAIREHVYQAIRRFGERPENARAAMITLSAERPDLAELFDGSAHGPAVVTAADVAISSPMVPTWLQEHFAPLIDDAEFAALFERAPLDVRLNPKKGEEQDILAAWPEARRSALPLGYSLPAGSDVERYALHEQGMVEIQDIGSQAIVAACSAGKPQMVLDMCAGAGGKTIGLAAQLPENTRIVAADSDRGRLSRIAPRIRRAAIDNIETVLLAPNREMESLAPFSGQCDLVLVDAPCTGTGTWRRNPELRWRMTPNRLQQVVALQQRLLTIASDLVAPGGRLVYAVCSLLDAEGGDQIEQFLVSRSAWRELPIDLPLGRPYRKGRLLSPKHDGTDGFYFSCLEKL